MYANKVINIEYNIHNFIIILIMIKFKNKKEQEEIININSHLINQTSNSYTKLYINLF